MSDSLRRENYFKGSTSVKCLRNVDLDDATNNFCLYSKGDNIFFCLVISLEGVI